LAAALTAAKEHPQTLDVTYCQLVRDPSPYIGTRIRLRAICVYGIEYYRLKPPQSCAEGQTFVSLGLQGPELKGRSRRLLSKINSRPGSYLGVFVGKLDAGRSYGYFGDHFQLTLDAIEKIERITKVTPSKSGADSLRLGDRDRGSSCPPIPPTPPYIRDSNTAVP
jgi:hypothetical protein